MRLVTLIEAFNESSEPKIDLRPTRDGRVGAILPRTGREILVEGSEFKEDVRVTTEDLAALCLEVHEALAPGRALLEAALSALVAPGDASASESARP